MKRSPRLLLIIMPFLLIPACLGTPETPKSPISTDTILPSLIPTGAMTGPSVPSPFPGLTITYILDGNVWLWDGSSRQLTNDGDAKLVKISDDSKVVVYLRGQSFSTLNAQSLWMCNTDDPSSPQVLVPLPIYDPENPSFEKLSITQFEFQPNSHWIYFSTGRSDGSTFGDLYRENADAPIESQELLEMEGGVITFSPDGNVLALSSLNSIKVIDADGSGLVNVLHYPRISLETGSIPQVVWMENETGFYTVLPDNAGISSKYLYVSADGSVSAQLADLQSDMGTPIISPDGLKVAYAKQNAAAYELHLVEASTTDTIIAAYEGAPMLIPWSWSPDSKRVVFSNAHPILLLTAGIGIPASPLTESVTLNSLRWISPDRFIFFREGNLLIGQINNPETILIASGFSNEVDTTYYDLSFNALP